MRETHNIDACPRASRPPPSQREARARRVVSRARRSHRSLPLETRPEPRVVRGLPKRSVSKRASTCRDARDERLLRAARARRPVRRERGQAEALDRRQDLQGAPRGSRRSLARARDAPFPPPAPANEGSRSPTSSGRTRRRRPFESDDEKCVKAWCRRFSRFCPILSGSIDPRTFIVVNQRFSFKTP